MIKVSNEELMKISQFMASCDDMIKGKFILADVKIAKILNMIAESQELYRFISECMIGYDFLREYHKAEVKNNLNGGVFSVPSEPSKLVAFVFCLLVECDAKRIDFYAFINENFNGEDRTETYNKFANQLLVPFKQAIANRFGVDAVAEQEVSNLTEQYREDLKQAPVFENEYGQTYYESQNFEQTNQYHNYQNEANVQNAQPNQNSTANFEMPLSKFQEEMEKDNTKKDIWEEIIEICSNVESAVYAERHLKQELREELLYILKTIKYSTKYHDVKIISALITAFDEMSKKFRSIQFVFGELKNKMQSLY